MSELRLCTFNTQFRLGMVLIVLFGVLPVAADDALLDYVTQKQGAARTLLDRYRMDYRVTIQHNNQDNGLSNPQTRELEVTKYKQGDRVRLEVAEFREGNNQYGSEGVRLGEYMDSSNAYLAINENEAAYWSARDAEVDGQLTVWRHTSPREMQQNAAGHAEQYQGVDLVEFAFGFKNRLSGGSGDEERIRSRLEELGTFEADEVIRDEKKVVEIRYRRDGNILMTAVVDPQKGYATTNLVLSASDAGVDERFEYEMSVKEVGDGVWAPDRLRATEWSSNAARVYDSSATAEVIALELDPVLDPAIFQWSSLNYPGQYIHVYDEAGIGTLMVAKDNRLQPAPFTNEAANTPEAIVAALSETISHEENVAPAAAVHPAPPLHTDAPALAVAVEVEVEDKGISVMAVLLGAAAVLAAGGALAWSRR